MIEQEHQLALRADVNGDGFADVLVGTGTGVDADEAYLVFGDSLVGSIETQFGDRYANTLNASRGAAIDILIGAQGEDLLISDGGSDVLVGGQGNDTLTVLDMSFRRITGGRGIDTLRLDASGTTLDLTTIADNRIVDIEQIDITGNGPNSLVLNQGELLNLSSHSNTLVVRRGSDDTVDFGNGWTKQADQFDYGRRFEVFTQGAATLKVEVPFTPLPPVIDAADLSGDTGTTIGPTTPGGDSNRSVHAAGDVNGDGFDDVIIDSYDGVAAEALVLFGSAVGIDPDADLSNLDPEDGFRISGAVLNGVPRISVSTAGDVNGDGLSDLMIGAPTADPSGRSDAGQAFVVFGSPNLIGDIDLNSLDGSTGFRIDGVTAGDQFGQSVASAENVNGDGFSDVVFGAPGAIGSTGQSFVVFGASSFAATFDLTTLDGTNGFRANGINSEDQSGFSVDGSGRHQRRWLGGRVDRRSRRGSRRS